jgi:peptide deformylase
MKILHYPSDITQLRRVARAVREDEFGTYALEGFGRELAELMLRSNGAGLAATQVDAAPGGKPWRVIAIRVGDGTFAALCNPEIAGRGEMVRGDEGCLSFASVPEQLLAPSWVVLRFRNLRGAPGEIMFTDRHARVVAHEVDHLDGRLVVDRMSPTKRSMFANAVRKRYRATDAIVSAAPN